MPIPPFDGVKDGLLYHLSNLSMQGFKVKKENIIVEVAGMRATKKRFDYNEDTIDARTADRTKREATRANIDGDGDPSDELPEVVMSPASSVKVTELLIIDVRQISAEMDDAVWSFEQTYMPYLKGSGMANCHLSDGNLKLSFELRKRKKPKTDEWEPVLCLHERSCSIQEIELVLQGDSRLVWIVNKLAAIFKTPLRDYVVRTIIGMLTKRSGWILEQLNSNLSPYWGLIFRTAGLSMVCLDFKHESHYRQRATRFLTFLVLLSSAPHRTILLKLTTMLSLWPNRLKTRTWLSWSGDRTFRSV